MKTSMLFGFLLFLLSTFSLAQYSTDFDGNELVDESIAAPHTGDLEEESSFGNAFPLNSFGNINSLKSNLNFDISKTYYVKPARLRVRSGPNLDSEILGVLARNTEVKLVTGELIGEFIEIEISAEDTGITTSEKYYTAYNYLSLETVEVEEPSFISKHFMIQNIATEKLRVYRRDCTEGVCKNILILETDMAVGEDVAETRTALGHYKVRSWHKFYQDGKGIYPSWYDPNFPPTPPAGSGVLKWTKNKYLPDNYPQASVRGAFGWYTLKVGPNSYSQWTHGTLGWGSDKKKYIRAAKGFWANLFTDPRSHGCSRTDNESIAYIRELIPVGSKLIKVYAKEAYGDPHLSSYSEHPSYWNYILTKNGVRIDGQRADREHVLSSGTSSSQFIEEGTYEIDSYPEAFAFYSGSSGARKGTNGNVYAFDHEDMQGVFLVDKGQLVNYRHPSSLKVGGYKDQLFPPEVIASKDTPYTMPKCRVVRSSDPRRDRYINSRCTEEW